MGCFRHAEWGLFLSASGWGLHRHTEHGVDEVEKADVRYQMIDIRRLERST
jgi:hypothetical protein